MSHKELLIVWYTELQKTKQYMQKLIDNGDLILEAKDTQYVKDIEKITGESTYRCVQDLDFINEYKEQVDLIVPLSNIFLFIQERGPPLKRNKTLDMFINIAQEFSRLFDIDMIEAYIDYRDRFTEEVGLVNISFQIFLGKLPEQLRNHKDWNYMIEIDKKAFNLI